MSNYTKLNIDDVEDMAPQFGLGNVLEARFARRALELRNFGVSYERVAPNARVPFGHRHAEQEEVYVVLSGGGRMKIDDEIVELAARDLIRVPAGATRQPEAGPDGLELIAIGAPQADDTEMIDGWWSD